MVWCVPDRWARTSIALAAKIILSALQGLRVRGQMLGNGRNIKGNPMPPPLPVRRIGVEQGYCQTACSLGYISPVQIRRLIKAGTAISMKKLFGLKPAPLPQVRTVKSQCHCSRTMQQDKKKHHRTVQEENLDLWDRIDMLCAMHDDELLDWGDSECIATNNHNATPSSDSGNWT